MTPALAPRQGGPSWWSKLKEEAERKRIEVLSTLIILIISAGLIGYLVPISINNAAIDRDNHQRCWDTTLEVRKSINTVQDGFALLPASPIPRRADLRAAQLTLRNAKFACHKVNSVARQLSSVDSYISSTDDLMNRSQAGTLTTNAEFEQTGFVVSISKWTDEVLQHLAD